MLSIMSHRWVSRKWRIYNWRYIASFTPTTLASVELRVLIFCFNEIDMGHLFPICMVAVVWLCIFECTTNDASIYQLTVLVPLACKVSLSSFVSCKNGMHYPKFFQSSLLGNSILAHKNETASKRSDWVLLPRYSSCAVKWWYMMAVDGSSLFVFLLVLSRCFAVGLVLGPFYSSFGVLAISWLIYFIIENITFPGFKKLIVIPKYSWMLPLVMVSDTSFPNSISSVDMASSKAFWSAWLSFRSPICHPIVICLPLMILFITQGSYGGVRKQTFLDRNLLDFF